ncbi:acyl-CoA dehydrogenase [Egibacter rhizosphaerae]|uniref:Acyl-CoA dehydrogenase n=1 Tax=Egibacter rhizosphaerae TaxID=1670831 RepID=A0A411YKN1_9ACTN|nr:acyl-CoA dehydrogenase family protein [Egibacter rhizosphaerae]QBI21740.1 acyl-CoA dehydrogenase [Egibacter rhizosphaerae]
MDFAHSARARELIAQVREFVEQEIYPAETLHREQVEASGDPHHHPPVMEELKAKARAAGLWNLFLPDEEWGAGLSNLEYAPLAEWMGRSVIGSEPFNCNAPDTGNMEVLAQYGTREQQEQWLRPLLDGEIRSCFAMTEPDVASSDATNIRASIERDGDDYVLNGRKWWTTGAARKRCRLAIFMGKSNPEADTYRQQSMILVPLDTAGIEHVRNLQVFGFNEGEGHAEIQFTGVRVPADHLLQREGDGFAIAQGRLGPGRIHHCMRAIGMAERALELLCRRAAGRNAFGTELARQGVVREWIADARCELEQARLLVLKAAWMMDEVGNKEARKEIGMIKVVAPNTALRVLDRAIQLWGGAGVSQDTPMAQHWAHLRTLRLADGPDEVHRLQIARMELREQLANEPTDPVATALAPAHG